MTQRLVAPFPYFGGKRRVADLVWEKFGKVDGYLEPFAGTLAVLLANPHPEAVKSETVNDLDGQVCNFWRSAAADPDRVAQVADWPVSHLDLTARHSWLRERSAELPALLSADMTYCEPDTAGVWLWGICQWIGGSFCEEKYAKRPHLANHGRGGFYGTIHALAQRLRYVRITCCDWSSLRSTLHGGSTRWGIFLDPPYSHDAREPALYGVETDVARDCAEWAREIGETHRVAFCGMHAEHDFPGWLVVDWKTGGYSYGDRDRRECIWFSPACLSDAQASLFGGAA